MRQSVAWTDRLLPRPDAPVVLALEGGPIPPGLVDGVHDLRSGVVPGAGAVLVPTGDQASADAADELTRSRPAEPRWVDAGARQLAARTASGAASPRPRVHRVADGLFPGDSQGNGTPRGPRRGTQWLPPRRPG